MHRSMRLPMLASVALLAFGGIAQAQQQAPQSPNMTFFVTGNGPGKGAEFSLELPTAASAQQEEPPATRSKT